MPASARLPSVSLECAARQRCFLGLQEGEAGLDALGGKETPDAAGDGAGDHRRGQLAGGGQ